jgi:hypothetical protein
MPTQFSQLSQIPSTSAITQTRDPK